MPLESFFFPCNCPSWDKKLGQLDKNNDDDATKTRDGHFSIRGHGKAQGKRGQVNHTRRTAQQRCRGAHSLLTASHSKRDAPRGGLDVDMFLQAQPARENVTALDNARPSYVVFPSLPRIKALVADKDGQQFK